MGVLDDFATSHAADAFWDGSEWFIAADAVPDLLVKVERSDARLLGLEGLLISEDATYPALSRIADFSHDSASDVLAKARVLLDEEWRVPPTPADQMHRDANGRHMLAVVIDES